MGLKKNLILSLIVVQTKMLFTFLFVVLSCSTFIQAMEKERKLSSVQKLNTEGVENIDTQLRRAVVRINDAEVEVLLDNGANPNLQNEGESSLIYLAVMNYITFEDISAIGSKAKKILINLLQYNADPNLRSYHKETPLHLAAKHSRYNKYQAACIDAISILLKYGADPSLINEDEKTPGDLVKEFLQYYEENPDLISEDKEALDGLAKNEIVSELLDAFVPRCYDCGHSDSMFRLIKFDPCGHVFHDHCARYQMKIKGWKDLDRITCCPQCYYDYKQCPDDSHNHCIIL
jgi:hypothetical protein